MANHPVDALNYAIRTRQLTVSALASAGIYYGKAPSQDALPAIVNFAYPARPHRTLAGIAWWDVDYEIIAIAEDAAGVSAQATIYPLAQANWELLDGGTATAQKASMDALNTLLASFGYCVMMPEESREVSANYDTINDKERWYCGHRFMFRIQPI